MRTRLTVAKKKQQGIVLLLLVIMLALMASSYYFSTISLVDIRLENMRKTQSALKQAKQALIAYAVTHADGNGNGRAGEFAYLPCPDQNAANVEGNQDPTCPGQFISELGYLPWRSLDMPVLKDGSGSCLWYAVSGSYKGEDTSGLINYDTPGQLQIYDTGGTLVADQIVAVVLAPGEALAGQNRNPDANSFCGKDYGNAAAYLEGNGVIDNAVMTNVPDAMDRFIHAALSTDTQAVPYNDYMVAITREEIWQAIMQRDDIKQLFTETTEALAQCLARYVNDNSNRRFPWPAPLNLADYRNRDSYSDVLNAAAGYAGRFPLHVDDSNAELGNGLDDHLVDNGFCDNLALPLTGGPNVDLTDTTLAHRIILDNWKDHFFYAVSKDYALPDNNWTGCGGSNSCVKVNGFEYSAIVFFGNIPRNGQLRAQADKSNVSNYLENNNDAQFPDTEGKEGYNSPNPAFSNDIIFCLRKTAMKPAMVTVSAC